MSSQLVLIPNGEHGGRAFDSAHYEGIVDQFLDEHLRGPVAPVVKKRRAVR